MPKLERAFTLPKTKAVTAWQRLKKKSSSKEEKTRKSFFVSEICLQMIGVGSRLYIAYYLWNKDPDSLYIYSALLLVQTTGPERTAFIYGVRFLFDHPAPLWWCYCGEESSSARSDELLAVQMIGDLLVGTGNGLRSTLGQEVEVVNGNVNWNCHHWVWSALEFLNRRRYISIPKSAAEVWGEGLIFCLQQLNPPNLTKPVPTCDILGKAITSEITETLAPEIPAVQQVNPVAGPSSKVVFKVETN